MAESKELALGPDASRRRVRQELRRAREAVALTQEDVAEAMRWHLSKMIRIETGTSGISHNDLRALLALYRVTDPATIETMLDWASRAKERTWWRAYRHAVPRPYAYYIALESEATAVRYVHSGLMPGLLQIEDYARAVSEASLWGVDEELMDQRVAIRLRRQREAFSRPEPLWVTAVLDEAVLRRTVGSPKVMKSQLKHLVRLAARPSVRIHVLPFTATARPFAGDGFVILELATPGDDAVYLDEIRSRTMDRRDDVDFYREIYDSMRRSALGTAESREFIQAVADTL